MGNLAQGSVKIKSVKQCMESFSALPICIFSKSSQKIYVGSISTLVMGPLYLPV